MKMISFVFFWALSSQAVSKEAFCVAHRSLGFGGIENSLGALTLASKAGASAIEFDLRQTKDNKTIVYHDETLRRLVTGRKCPVGKRIKELNFSQIREHCKLKNGEIIPTFEEALVMASQFNSTLFVEFKGDVITSSDVDVLNKIYGTRPEKIMIISFNQKILEEVERRKKIGELSSEINTLKLQKEGNKGHVNSFSGMSTKKIDSKRLKALQAQGKLVGVYTKNKKDEILKFLSMGADFITTDKYPLCNSLISRD